MPPAFESIGLSKTFHRWSGRRQVHALRDVSLVVEPGAIFGLLGPNGAGKTTLVKIALTIAHASKGEVQLLGQFAHRRSILGKVGYLPENPRFPMHLTAQQVLMLYGSMSGADIHVIRRNAAIWLERLDLAQWSQERVSGFSKGMIERLAFAQALVHEPDLVFLDEPTAGLDPLGRMEVRSICRELAAAGKTIFINSHILTEIELICDRIALMRGGRIVEQGTIGELTAGDGEYELVVPAGDSLRSWLAEHRFAFAGVNGNLHVQVPDRQSANALIDVLRQKDIEVESLSVKRRTLEAVFLARLGSPLPEGESSHE